MGLCETTQGTCLVHLHGKAHGGIDRANASRLELGDDVRPDLGNLVTGTMKFEIGDRPRSTAQRLTGHAYDKAEQRLGPWIIVQDLVALRIEAGAGDLDQTGIMGAAVKGELAQRGCVHFLSGERARLLVRPKPRALHCRMIFELHPWGPSKMMRAVAAST